MFNFREKLDQLLIDLAWSLWTELGVAGVKRKHQNFLIAPEELLVLTSVVAEIDPRLRDEALDWCTRYHHFISISRLRTIANDFGDSVTKPLSIFSATLNSVSQAHWPLFTPAEGRKFAPSGKSKLPPLDLPALLCFRLRSAFGVGARADVLTFFLTQKKTDFAIADVTEIGYSKRNLADVLNDFVHAGIFEMFMLRNQQRYSLAKRDQMIKLLEPIPEYTPSLRLILEVVLPLRECMQRTEKHSESSAVVEMRNTLQELTDKLHRLSLIPPPLQSDFHAYWHSIGEWTLGITQSLFSDIPDQL